MTWSEKDKVLFSIVNIFGKEHLEEQIEDASEKFSQLKTRPPFFSIFGYYNLDKNVFVWQNGINEVSYDFVKNNYMTLFKSDETIKKLFQPVVHFDKKDMNVIPYLMEALNAQFNVVRFKSRTDYIYALTIIDGVKETFKYEDFDTAMFTYRFLEEPDNKPHIKHKKSKSKRRNRTQKRKERV
jgi:hypothetical protein